MSVKVGHAVIREYLFLGIVLLLAACLRLYRLDEGLWFDEIITFINYGDLPFREIATTFNSENNHVLYSHFAHASLLIFGNQGWALRLPAVVFGVASLVALYFLGKLIANQQEAILAVALLTVSYHHIWFSQNARGYTALLFWTILSTYFLLRGLQENRLAWWLFYGLSAALGMYTHLTMGFVIAGQFLAYIYQIMRDQSPTSWRKWQGIWAGFACGAILTLLLYAPVLGKISSAMDATLTGVPEVWNSPLWTILETLKGLRVGFSQTILLAAALALLAAGILGYSRNNPAFILIFLLPPIIGAAVTLAFGHPLWPRFFFFAAGFGALVVVRGLMMLSSLAARWLRLAPQTGYQLGVILGIAMILASAWSARNVYGPKQDYEGALEFIEASQQSGDAIVVTSLTVPPYKEFLNTDWFAVQSISELNAIRKKANRTWMIVTFPNVLQASYPEINQMIQTDFQLVKVFWGTLGDGQVYIYNDQKGD